MRLGVVVAVFLFSCSGSGTSKDPITKDKPAGAACEAPAECEGGACLGASGQPQEENPRFAGGYCTAVTCVPDSQDGCGPDEFCIDGGDDLPSFCVPLCSKAEGLECERDDHVCIGLGSFGGCFSREAVECNRKTREGCKPAETCVRIGYEDPDLGRCETTCDPTAPVCPEGQGCYFIRTYSTAFCNVPGTSKLDEPCACDKCCVPGLACTPDLDGSGRHCKKVCEIADGCSGGATCVSLKRGSPWGGCVAD
jgi:hypothetical protein